MRRSARLVSMALVVVILTGLGGSSADAAPRRPVSRQNCAHERNALTGLTVLYGDENASYWGSTYSVQNINPATTYLRIYGEYPKARYMSIQGYDHLSRDVDGLTDFQIAPDPGSGNPFAHGAPRNPAFRNWTVTIRFTPPPAVREPNTIYLGLDADGNANRSKISWVYRIYLPDQGQNIQGGVIVPRLSVIREDGRAVCPPIAELFIDDDDWVGAAEADPLLWKKFTATTALSNVDIGYMVAVANFVDFDPLLVLRFKRPTFSNTTIGQTIDTSRNMRYMSVSLAAHDGYPRASRADNQLVVDSNGIATIVFSTLLNKPSDSTLQAKSAIWISASPLQVTDLQGSVVFRHLLPNANFAASIKKLAADDTDAEIRDAMDEFYPLGVYCTNTQFTQNGCQTSALQQTQQSSQDKDRKQSPAPIRRPSRSGSTGNPAGSLLGLGWG
jgi:hypothetical protein